MTTPYSPETATALAIGATTMGYVENGSYVTYDLSLALYNNKVIAEQTQYLLMDQRRREAQFRAEFRTAMGITPKSTPRILVCGDSLTMGVGSSDGVGYPGWIGELLDRQNIKATVGRHAQSGWSIGNVSAGMAAALAANTPDIVTIHIGTNDAGGNLSNFGSAYTALINQILASSPTVKVACSLIPIAQGGPASYRAGAAQANTIIGGVVAGMASARVVTADLRAAHMAAWNSNPALPTTPPGRWTIDGMHPVDPACLKTAEALLVAVGGWIPGYQAAP